VLTNSDAGKSLLREAYDDSNGVRFDLQEALQQQLALQLNEARIPMRLVVIDHAEMPTEKLIANFPTLRTNKARVVRRCSIIIPQSGRAGLRGVRIDPLGP
jgi:hypothetical protein